MRNQLKKWFAVLMAMVLGMPGYGLSIKNITTKAEDESIAIHVENEERHVQTGETVSLLDGVSVEGSGEESYRAVVGDVQEQDSGLSLYEEGMEELVIPEDASGKTYRVLYKAQSSIDNEVWNDVEGSEKEALLIVNGSHEEIAEENKEETSEEESKEEEETEKEENNQKEEETPQPVTVTLQGKEKEEAEVGEVFSFVHDDNVIMNIPEEDEKDYRIIVTEVNTPENGSYSYKEGDISFIPQKGDEGLTYIIHYGVETSKDGAESFERVEGVSFTKEVTVITVKKVTIQGEEERTILAENEYDFIRDSDLVVKGPKEEENSYRLKVKEVKSPENGSYQYHEGDESFTPKESDEGLVYEVTYVAETSKDKTTWKEVEDVQFIQKLTVAVFRAEEVRGPLATEAILCTGQQFNNFVANWNSGSSTTVKNLVKADVPSDLMTASLRYKYETISDPSSPVKIYMWHDMNAYGQYTDTVYFGTEVPGATIYTNQDASQMFGRNTLPFRIEKLYDSANPSTPYFFNTSKTTNMSRMFWGINLSAMDIPLDCTNGNGISPLSLMDTSNVTDLSNMFAVTRYLDLTGIETWNVHKVTDISGFLSDTNRIKIPWGIGNWEFDNLQNVERCFYFSYNNSDENYEVNVTNWDFSHCDTSKLFKQSNEYGVHEGLLSRIGIGPKFADKNGKVWVPHAHKMDLINFHQGTDLYFNGTWQNENTGAQYFQRRDIGQVENSSPIVVCLTGNGESYTEFEEAYLANPNGMSGTYVFGKGHFVNYEANGAAFAKDANGAKTRFYCYKNTDLTTTAIANPFTYAYHYFQKWEKYYLTGIVKNPGDTITLDQNYTFQAIWAGVARTITYDLDGGVNNSGNPTTFVAKEYKVIGDPTKSGMIFAGWTWTSASKSMPDPWYIYNTLGTNTTDPSAYDPSKAFPDEDIVLKAHWASPRTITIHGNGGMGAGYYSGTPAPDISYQLPDINDMRIIYHTEGGYDKREGYYFEARGRKFYIEFILPQSWPQYVWKYDSHKIISLKDGLGATTFGDIQPPTVYPFIATASASLPVGTNEFYIQWGFSPKKIKIQFNPTLSFPYDMAISCPYVAPDGSSKVVHDPHGINSNFYFQEYTGKQWDEDSPNVTLSIKGHETGTTNEYVFDNFEELTWNPGDLPKAYFFQSFTISSPGSSHTYPTGNLTSYTFTGGFDKDVTITFNWIRAWRVQYVNLDDTPITTMQTLKEADLPYTFRNTYPPHAPWHGFPVLPVGWTIKKYNEGSPDAEGIYTSTGNLPTLYRGTWDATQFDSAQSTLKLYPMYSVDVNKDGIPDVFQNKNTLTVSKEVVKGQYSDLTSLASKVFPYEITFKDVHGDPIKNWPIQDTNGNNYTTDTNGKVTINLRHQESVTFKGMLVGMIIQAVETDTKGMSAEYAISYNGTSFTSGSDTGSITYQDNTPLTVTFKNTAGGNIVPAGIKDTNTRVYVLLGAVLIALAFSIRMLKVRRRA